MKKEPILPALIDCEKYFEYKKKTFALAIEPILLRPKSEHRLMCKSEGARGVREGPLRS